MSRNRPVMGRVGHSGFDHQSLHQIKGYTKKIDFQPNAAFFIMSGIFFYVIYPDSLPDNFNVDFIQNCFRKLDHSALCFFLVQCQRTYVVVQLKNVKHSCFSLSRTRKGHFLYE